MIEAMVAGTAPMSKWVASVDYSTYDQFEEYLQTQLRDKLTIKVSLDARRKDSSEDEGLATFVDGGTAALEGALATYRVVRERVAASRPSGDGIRAGRAEVIEECARVADEYPLLGSQIASAIRALIVPQEAVNE